MKKKPQWLRNLSKTSKNISDGVSGAFRNISSLTLKHSKNIDEEYEFSETIKSASKATQEYLSEVDEKYSISDKAVEVKNSLIEAGSKISQATKESGALDKVDELQQSFQKNIFNPVSNYAVESGFNDCLCKVLDMAEIGYGEARTLVKPYYAPETPNELLQNTKEELIYINSCILQISADEAEKLANKLGSAIISKVAGAASVGVLFSMVSAFGTAGTGTAITGLSGAAATNATLAWVGGLLGGGMAAGAVLTGGLALVVGVGVYKLIGTEARSYDKLSEQERRIVESTGFLIAAINDLLQNPDIHLDSEEAQLLLNNTLKPLHQSLIDESDHITQSLDSRHGLLYRQHALKYMWRL